MSDHACPTCRGVGHLDPTTTRDDREYGMECPSCGGSGLNPDAIEAAVEAYDWAMILDESSALERRVGIAAAVAAFLAHVEEKR